MFRMLAQVLVTDDALLPNAASERSSDPLCSRQLLRSIAEPVDLLDYSVVTRITQRRKRGLGYRMRIHF